MLKYLVTRFVLIVPTVWFIGSVIFILSRLIPGTFADQVAESKELGTGSRTSIRMDRIKYLRKLELDGKDKPVFYFSFQTLAQPDTLVRVYPTQHQKLLSNLIGRYGNWPDIADYYLALRQLWEKNALSSTNQGSLEVQELIEQLLYTADPGKIKAILKQIKSKAWEQSLKETAKETEELFFYLESNAQPYNNLIPVLRWHGSNNLYHIWLTSLLKGNLGKSILDQQPVLMVLKEAISNTLLLLFISLLLIFLLAIEISLMLARKNNGWQKLVLSGLYILDGVPIFVTALLLLAFFAVVDLLPLFGLGSGLNYYQNWFEQLIDQLHHLILPAICLVLAGLPYVTTQIYRAMQQIISATYITTAQAKGLSPKKVLRRHVFRNALLPVITLFTGYLSAIISGALIIEVIFAIPGTGRLLAKSVLDRDYPVMLGLILFIAALKAGSHLLADFMYFKADPRTRQKLS